VYSEKLLMMDRRTVRNIQSFITKINLRNLLHLVGFVIRITAEVVRGEEELDDMALVTNMQGCYYRKQ